MHPAVDTYVGGSQSGNVSPPTETAIEAPDVSVEQTLTFILALSSTNVLPGCNVGSLVVAVSGVASSCKFFTVPPMVVYLTQTPFARLSVGGKLS